MPTEPANGSGINDTITATGASAAITSPWWIPTLEDVSVYAAEFLPILGAIWLVVQILVKLMDTYKGLSK